MSRFLFVDALRGVAAFLVVFQHVFEDALPGYSVVMKSAPNFGVSGIVLFFWISGIVIPHTLRRSSIKEYFYSRVFRIYPLYWFVLLLVFLASFFEFYENKSHLFYNFFSLLLNLSAFSEYFGFQVIHGVSWTLSLELAWYAIFAVYYFSPLRSLSAFDCVVVSCVLYIVCSILSVSLDVRLPLGRMAFVMIALQGFLFYEHILTRRDDFKYFLGLGFSLVSVFLGLYVSFSVYSKELFSFTSLVFSYALSFFLIAFIFFLIRMESGRFFVRILAYLGLISYSTYLIHPIVRDLFLFYVGNVFFAITLSFIFIYFTSIVSYFFVERNIISLSGVWRKNNA